MYIDGCLFSLYEFLLRVFIYIACCSKWLTFWVWMKFFESSNLQQQLQQVRTRTVQSFFSIEITLYEFQDGKYIKTLYLLSLGCKNWIASGLTHRFKIFTLCYIDCVFFVQVANTYTLNMNQDGKSMHFEGTSLLLCLLFKKWRILWHKTQKMSGFLAFEKLRRQQVSSSRTSNGVRKFYIEIQCKKLKFNQAWLVRVC